MPETVLPLNTKNYPLPWTKEQNAQWAKMREDLINENRRKSLEIDRQLTEFERSPKETFKKWLLEIQNEDA